MNFATFHVGSFTTGLSDLLRLTSGFSMPATWCWFCADVLMPVINPRYSSGGQRNDSGSLNGNLADEIALAPEAGLASHP